MNDPLTKLIYHATCHINGIKKKYLLSELLRKNPRLVYYLIKQRGGFL